MNKQDGCELIQVTAVVLIDLVFEPSSRYVSRNKNSLGQDYFAILILLALTSCDELGYDLALVNEMTDVPTHKALLHF